MVQERVADFGLTRGTSDYWGKVGRRL